MKYEECQLGGFNKNIEILASGSEEVGKTKLGEGNHTTKCTGLHWLAKHFKGLVIPGSASVIRQSLPIVAAPDKVLVKSSPKPFVPRYTLRWLWLACLRATSSASSSRSLFGESPRTSWYSTSS